MTTRVLPTDEWPSLAGTEAEAVWPHLVPNNTQVFVVEDEGRIVGCWIAMRVVHAECLWIAESHRAYGFAIGRRLWRSMRQQVREWGGSVFLTAALTDNVRALIARFGGRAVPGDVFALPAIAGKDTLCQD